jgi:hypothetical protein
MPKFSVISTQRLVTGKAACRNEALVGLMVGPCSGAM